MKVKRSRKTRRSRRQSRSRIHTRSGRRSMDQMHKLRIWMIVLALLATAAVVGTVCYFCFQFAEPFRLAAERNAAGISSTQYENHDELPLYDDSFNLVLVNRENRLPDAFTVSLTKVDGVEVEARIAVYLERMLADAESDGVDLQVKSGYVSVETQSKRYQERIEKLMNSGMSRMKAEEDAKRTVGDGGYSEYQTGMAVDFSTKESGAFQDTAAYRWLLNNSIHYGFVLRYPANKTSHTQMQFDPDHFRFVGVKHATRMRELEMCLEEYANYVKMQAYS